MLLWNCEGIMGDGSGDEMEEQVRAHFPKRDCFSISKPWEPAQSVGERLGRVGRNDVEDVDDGAER